MNVTTGQVLKYTLLPGILPRIFSFFGSGFYYLAYYIAQVYRTMRLLPPDHPYLQIRNVGKFGVRHVIFEAKRNLVYKWENIDQIILFFMLILGMILMMAQFAIVIFGVIVPAATAASGAGDTAYLASFFTTPDPTYDIAFRLLDATFGFNDTMIIFNSCLAQGVQCQLAFAPGGGFSPVGPVLTVPTPFHEALHLLFQFYNLGVLAIGVAVFLYFIVAIVAETAQSGTPFGKRFNGAWAPIRLFIAIALLTPLSFGMNGAQLLTLYIAKAGSGMATNGWNGFLDDLAGETLAGEPAELVVTPKTPMINTLIEFLFVAQACRFMEEQMEQRDIQAYHVFGTGTGGSDAFVGKAFLDALADTNNTDITIRFGVKDDDRYTSYKGNVKPICGELTLTVKDVAQDGALMMQEGYFDLVATIWDDAALVQRAENVVRRLISTTEGDVNATPVPDNAFMTAVSNYFTNDISDLIDDSVAAQIASADWIEDQRVLGWAGAAIWYNKIAEMNGGLFSSVFSVPSPGLYPEVMEFVQEQRRQHNDVMNGEERFNPVLSNGEMIEYTSDRQLEKAVIYYNASTYWRDTVYAEPSGNAFLDTIVAVFGLEGLLDMQDNLEIHPLAQLVGVGRSLIESAITNLGYSFGAGIAGGLAGILGRDIIKSVAASASSFAGKVATIGLSLGFILYYIIPFLPFIYFFFAVGGWVKSIFEAMVGLPLWALAHIRIDGDGLPGPAAMNGYFLIFEIFIRPLLIIFGLIAAVSIFAAQVEVLNEIWKLVTTNLVGYDTTPGAFTPPPIEVDNGWGANVGAIDYMRADIDRLFHTVIYTMIVYMMAMASFKLIDMIPNNILRWMGTSVSTFAEQADDPAGSLVRYAYIGSQGALSGLSGGFNSLLTRAAR